MTIFCHFINPQILRIIHTKLVILHSEFTPDVDNNKICSGIACSLLDAAGQLCNVVVGFLL